MPQNKDEISFLLGEIHQKVTSIHQRQESFLREHNALEDRVRKLEIKQWTIAGVATGFGMLMTDAGKKIIGIIGGH